MHQEVEFVHPRGLDHRITTRLWVRYAILHNQEIMGLLDVEKKADVSAGFSIRHST